MSKFVMAIFILVVLGLGYILIKPSWVMMICQKEKDAQSQKFITDIVSPRANDIVQYEVNRLSFTNEGSAPDMTESSISYEEEIKRNTEMLDTRYKECLQKGGE